MKSFTKIQADEGVVRKFGTWSVVFTKTTWRKGGVRSGRIVVKHSTVNFDRNIEVDIGEDLRYQTSDIIKNVEVSNWIEDNLSYLRLLQDGELA